ncbi:MAG TPA: sigma 54-interacting transcriptional regulator [Polyangia bacterium]
MSRKPDDATPAPSAVRAESANAPAPIHARLGTPALKSLDPAAARWIATLIRVSSGHPAMTRILDVVERLSDHPYRTNAVLWGEPGTGKGGLGRALAQLMAPGRPLVRLDVKGFSTDAALDALCGQGNRPGAAERAHTGFLLIEEIVDLPAQVQETLLRLLKTGRVRRQGTERDLPEKLQIGVIALSDHDVAAAVAAGQLRDDLYWRLARVLLWLPPLRERLDDLSAAAVWMGNRILGDAGIPLNLHTTEDLERATPAERRRAIELDVTAIEALRHHGWPGNFRELEATLERALLLQRRGPRLGAEQIRTALALGRNP